MCFKSYIFKHIALFSAFYIIFMRFIRLYREKINTKKFPISKPQNQFLIYLSPVLLLLFIDYKVLIVLLVITNYRTKCKYLPEADLVVVLSLFSIILPALTDNVPPTLKFISLFANILILPSKRPY